MRIAFNPKGLQSSGSCLTGATVNGRLSVQCRQSFDCYSLSLEGTLVPKFSRSLHWCNWTSAVVCSHQQGLLRAHHDANHRQTEAIEQAWQAEEEKHCHD